MRLHSSLFNLGRTAVKSLPTIGGIHGEIKLPLMSPFNRAKIGGKKLEGAASDPFKGCWASPVLLIKIK